MDDILRCVCCFVDNIGDHNSLDGDCVRCTWIEVFEFTSENTWGSCVLCFDWDGSVIWIYIKKFRVKVCYRLQSTSINVNCLILQSIRIISLLKTIICKFVEMIFISIKMLMQFITKLVQRKTSWEQENKII